MEQERLIYSDVYSLVCGDFFGSGLVANVEALWRLSSFFLFFSLPRVAEVRERRNVVARAGRPSRSWNPIRIVSPDEEGSLARDGDNSDGTTTRCSSTDSSGDRTGSTRISGSGSRKIAPSSFASNRSDNTKRVELLERSHAIFPSLVLRAGKTS